MKKIISIISVISITWLLASCSASEYKYQTNNSSILANSTNSEITLSEDSSTISEENQHSDNENNISQKPESSYNYVSKNNSTTKPSDNNSTPKEPSVDKTPTKIDYNPNLTWEEAYVDNGDGTFQLMFVDGQVYTYVPHPTEEGTYLRKGSSGMGQTFELVKLVWDCQWCKYCGELTKFCHRYGIDITCYDCGVMAKAHTCHICGKN